MWDRSKLFLRRAGTVILGITIVLWFLETYPRNAETEKKFAQDKQTAIAQYLPSADLSHLKESELQAQLQATLAKPGAETNSPAEFALNARLKELTKEHAGDQLRNSFAGHVGHAIAPVIAPLGFDWRMGIGIIGSFAAREVFVSTMSTVYNVGNDDSETHTADLARTLREQKHEDGTPVYTTLTAVTLMVFYVFALQCVSTVAVVRRETNSWKWPLFQWIYMAILAWGFAFVTFHGGRLLGWG